MTVTPLRFLLPTVGLRHCPAVSELFRTCKFGRRRVFHRNGVNAVSTITRVAGRPWISWSYGIFPTPFRIQRSAGPAIIEPRLRRTLGVPGAAVREAGTRPGFAGHRAMEVSCPRHRLADLSGNLYGPHRGGRLSRPFLGHVRDLLGVPGIIGRLHGAHTRSFCLRDAGTDR